MLAKPWVVPIFENSPYVNQILVYDSEGKHKGLFGKLKLARDLRQFHFDAAILLQNAFEAALITFLAGIPYRIGYDTDGRGALLTHSISCTPDIKKTHQTNYYMGILQAMGLITDGQTLNLEVNPKDEIRAREILRLQGISPEGKWVGINPAATYGPAKQWFPDRYAELADRIRNVLERPIVLFGGPGDQDLGAKITRLMQHQPVDLSGKTTLGEAMALIKCCELFITNDSGLMHVAAALNVPLIAIFGSTNPETTGPWNPSSRIVRVSTECSPCLKPDCPENHLNCMKQIDVDMVFQVVKEIL
jgi:heptosyltransferase-2